MKVSINKPTGKKYRHNLSNNVYTTSSFGFCQPIFCRECASQDTLKLRTANMVYLNPVVKPTFGRLSIKQYKTFVPIEDIWHPFASFLAQKSYHGTGGSYVPNQVPSAPLGVLTGLVYLCSRVAVFELSDDSVSSGSLSFTSLTQVPNPSSTELNLLVGTIRQAVSSSWGSFMSAAQSYVSDASRNYFVFDQDSYTVDDLGNFDWFLYSNHSSQKYLFAGRFTERGKNLRKILIGLGYQLSLFNDEKTLLPIFAYYKAWFDLFAVQRTMTWKDSNAFFLLEYNEQTGRQFHTLTGQFNLFCSFFYDDLASCYYTISPDFASAHISGTALGTNTGRPYDGPNGFSPGDSNSVKYVEVGSDKTPVIPSNFVITQEGLNVLRALYERVNIKTAIGGRIKDFMRSIFGAQYDQEDESNFIGASSYNVDITQVMSTAETEQGYLGEYAGKGIGSSTGDSYTFTARKQGYYIEFFAIVPDSRLAQAVDPNLNHIDRNSFFDSSFDSITLLPSKKDSIYGTHDLGFSGGDVGSVAGFGNIPNYMEYKISFDKINGDMSMMSTRDSYLPFTLSKLLPYTMHYNIAGVHVIQNVDYTPIVCGDFWRYIGRFRWLGNYDRIFVNSGFNPPFNASSGNSLEYRFDDNFVIYFYCDIDLSGYELPISGSWQTGAGSGNTDTVEKA